MIKEIKERDEQVIDHYKAKWPIYAIADKFKLSYKLTQKIIRGYKRELGQVRPHKGMGSIKPLFKARNDAILEMLNQNKPVHEIASELNTSPSAVYSVLKANRIEIKQIKLPRKLSHNTIRVIELNKNGVSNSEIAKVMNLTRQRVWAILKKYGED